MRRTSSILALACLGLNGCVAPLMLAPAMLSSAMPAMGVMSASTAARAASQNQQGAYAKRPPPKFESPWAAKKKAEQTATTQQ